MVCRLLAATLVLAVAAIPAAAAGPADDEQALVKKVNGAIDKGVQYLRQTRDARNQWEKLLISNLADMDGGVTSLAVLALLNTGLPATDKDIKPALDYIRRLEPKKTYVVGIATMALAEGRDPNDKPRIQANVDWLLKTVIRENGKITGWSYPLEKGAMSRADASNTQYALLGLYAGKQAGAKIDDKVWRDLRQLYLDTMKPDGPNEAAWYYVEDKSFSPTGSFTMTAAGVSGLVIAGMGLNDNQQQLDPATGVAAKCGIYADTDAIARGMNWLGKRFSFFDAPQAKVAFYNVYGIERVGRLSGQRFIGKFDWYREGCEKLVAMQRPEGFWQRRGGLGFDNEPVLATSFSLLFLSKGRTPILISKLAHGSFEHPDKNSTAVLVEKGEAPGIVGWNRKHNDARNLTEFASRELFQGLPLGWQVYDPRRKNLSNKDTLHAEVGVLVQSPILYFNGHRKLAFTGEERTLLKKYIEEGGFVFAEACCGSPEFADSFRALMADLFPDNPLKKMPAEHAIWRSFFAVPPSEFSKLECLDRGCRTVVVFSPEPLAGYWEETRFAPAKGQANVGRGELAYRLAGNVIAYATGMEPPKQRLSVTRIVDEAKIDHTPPNGFVKPLQLKLPDEAAPAPAAMRNLMAHLQTAAKIDVSLDPAFLFPSNDELFKYRFVYMHGRKGFSFTDKELENLRANLQAGGLLFADACCGNPQFDDSFRKLVPKLFPDAKLEVIPADDDLYSAKLNGAKIASVKRREKADASGPDGGFKDLPPLLEGIKIDGRWAIVYSKYDIGCALEGHKASDCLGHTRDSALQLATAAALYALKR